MGRRGGEGEREEREVRGERGERGEREERGRGRTVMKLESAINCTNLLSLHRVSLIVSAVFSCTWACL